MHIGERETVIGGVGLSDVGRRLHRDGLDLTVQAALAALDDAGLTREDIDGVSTFPGGSGTPGPSPCGVRDIKEALGLELSWFSGGGETPGQYGAIFNGIAAVAAGLCRNVLCFRTVTEATAGVLPPPPGGLPRGRGGPSHVTGIYQWQRPFHAPGAASMAAMSANRYMHDYGLTREQLAEIPLSQRRNAQHNPKAVYTDPMTLDDYLSVRMVTTPFGLFDCDVPVDGSVVIIISRRDEVPNLRKPVGIEAIGSALSGRDSWDQRADIRTMAATDAAAMMWKRTALTQADVDVVELYDGFSFLAAAWLEALGFCGQGELGSFLEGGKQIAWDGPLPLNTHGGQLSAGRLHGFGFVHEACQQIRCEATGRQAADPQVAIAAAGGGPLGGCMLLTRT